MKPQIELTDNSITIETDEVTSVFTFRDPEAIKTVAMVLMRKGFPTKVSKNPATETGRKKRITPRKQCRYSKKLCTECGNEYLPSGPRQEFCSHKCKKLHKEKINKLDRTLEEVHRSQNKPYTFDRT
jgi:hypothetical protein